MMNAMCPHPKSISWLLSLSLAAIYFTYAWWQPAGHAAFLRLRQACVPAWAGADPPNGAATHDAGEFAYRLSDEDVARRLSRLSSGAAGAEAEAAVFSVVQVGVRAEAWAGSEKDAGDASGATGVVWE